MGKYTAAWNKLKPQRPKRPGGAFARFLSNYNAFSSSEDKPKGKLLFRDAAEAWNALTDMEKALFVDQDSLDAYKKDLAQFKAKMSAMRGPPSAYALYVRYYWKTHDLTSDGNRTEFGKIQQRIANDWNKLDETEKNVYKASSDLLKALFKMEQAAVTEEKRPLNLDWQNAGLKDLEAGLYKKQGEKQVEKEAEKEKDPQEQDQYETNDQQQNKDDDAKMDTDDDDDDDEYSEKFDYSLDSMEED